MNIKDRIEIFFHNTYRIIRNKFYSTIYPEIYKQFNNIECMNYAHCDCCGFLGTIARLEVIDDNFCNDDSEPEYRWICIRCYTRMMKKRIKRRIKRHNSSLNPVVEGKANCWCCGEKIYVPKDGLIHECLFCGAITLTWTKEQVEKLIRR